MLDRDGLISNGFTASAAAFDLETVAAAAGRGEEEGFN